MSMQSGGASRTRTIARSGSNAGFQLLPRPIVYSLLPLKRVPKRRPGVSLDTPVQANDLQCQCPVVERARPRGRGQCVQFIPYRFEFSNKLTKQHKLLLAFDALALSDAIERNIRLGKIVHGDRSATLSVKSSSLISEARMGIKSCAALRSEERRVGKEWRTRWRPRS